MKITQSKLLLAPPLKFTFPRKKTITIPHSYKFKFIKIPSKQIKPICHCTIQEENKIYDVVSCVKNGGVLINIEKIEKRVRKVEASVSVNAGFEIVWGILTDYERLSDFIPALAISRLLEQRRNYARLFQIGEQNLPFGFKFNAKAVIDCYEKDLEVLAFGQRRDIDFNMVEGDFDIFEGKWSVQEYDAEKCEDNQVLDLLEGNEHGTILSYVVQVKPKPWLPVGLIEDRLCKEIKTNLCCVRDEAHLRLASSLCS